MNIKVKYFNESEKLTYIGGEKKSNWIDLRAAGDTFIPVHDFALVPLGIAMEIPDGYEAHIVPRSSTFKTWGIIQTNHMGIVDNSYKGDNDQWFFPAYCVKAKDTNNGVIGTMIKKGDRICQFRIMANQPEIVFTEVEHLDNPDRGGHGSTGIA